jgi:nucleoid-associated protein YgaU
MIIRGSRYENASILRVTTADGSTQFAIYPTRMLLTEQVTFVQRTVVAGDRLDTLAHRYYQNSLLWWIIARANPEILYPDDIPPGTILRIPDASSIR